MDRIRLLLGISGVALGLVMAVVWGARQTMARTAQLGGSDTTITYQGVLDDDGHPAEGVFDFQFLLYDAPSGGSQVGTTQLSEDLEVAEGFFTALLDFGDVWDGTQYYLQIEVRPALCL